MARYVPDTASKRWVILALGRARRPRDHGGMTPVTQRHESGHTVADQCPFCYGNEHLTPPEIGRWSHPGSHFNWSVRVVPNLYPITDVHEVIVHSPDHEKDILDFSPSHLELIIRIYRERFRALSPQGQVIIFNNKGEAAGESLTHPHSQLTAIPHQIKLDILSLEPLTNVVAEVGDVVCYCPDYSEWPYELWLTTRANLEPDERGWTMFGALADGAVADVAAALQRGLGTLRAVLGSFSYHYYISPAERWSLRITPRIVTRAGFELGTGLVVNTKDPVEAAAELAAAWPNATPQSRLAGRTQ